MRVIKIIDDYTETEKAILHHTREKTHKFNDTPDNQARFDAAWNGHGNFIAGLKFKEAFEKAFKESLFNKEKK
jgi:hypothetical protein